MTVDGLHLRVVTQGVGQPGAVQVARPLDEVDSLLDRCCSSWSSSGGGIALGGARGAVARTALAPIARSPAAPRRWRPTSISERMEVTGDDELARLAHSFNTTLDALEQAVEAQRQLVADASHELRTPIASLRANIQTLEEPTGCRRPSARRCAPTSSRSWTS